MGSLHYKERARVLLIESGTHHIVAFLLTILLDLVWQGEAWTRRVAKLGCEAGDLRVVMMMEMLLEMMIVRLVVVIFGDDFRGG